MAPFPTQTLQPLLNLRFKIPPTGTWLYSKPEKFCTSDSQAERISFKTVAHTQPGSSHKTPPSLPDGWAVQYPHSIPKNMLVTPSEVWTLTSPGDRARRDVGSPPSGQPQSSHSLACRIQKRMMLRPGSKFTEK